MCLRKAPFAADEIQKSVETDTERHVARMAASEACLASMAATVSLPKGRRTGG